jgi:predicted metalloprotease with PDZ domain
MLCILLACSVDAQSIRYTIWPEIEAKTHTLTVEVEVAGDADGETIFYYQDNQFGEPEQFKFIRLGAGAEDAKLKPDSNQIIIKHEPGKWLKFMYQVHDLQQANEPFYQYCCYKPIIKQEYFHIQSGHLLMYPKDFWPDDKARRQVHIEWKNLPEAWIVHSSFGVDALQGGFLTQTEVGVGVFVGGDFRRYRFEIEDQPVYFLTRGKWKIDEYSILHILKKTFQGHRDFWRDHSDTIYSVTFIPIDDAPWNAHSRMFSIGGSGLTNSFMSYASNNDGLVLEPIRYVYVHELMHRWIGIHIENAHEEQEYWFSEGFTDYYTYKMMLKYDLISLDDWLKELNSVVLFKHYTSTIKSRPNSEMNYERFWNGGQEWEKLAYRRGCIFALYLDQLIKKRSKGRYSLDEPMRQILAECKLNHTAKFDRDLLVRVLIPYLGKQAERDVAKYIDKGIPIGWTKKMLPKGLKLRYTDGAISSGPNRDGVSKVVAYRNVPKFYKSKQMTDSAISEGLIK